MRIDVLNGVNLDLLGRRSPEVYGPDSLQDLETKVYAWARELDLQARCRQTNHEGEYVEWLHQALDAADGLVLNPGAWTHYSWAIRDAAEAAAAPIVEVHLSDVERARGVAPRERSRRPHRRPHRRQGPGRLPRCARGPLPRRAMTRTGRLARTLELPLLVTGRANVRYLTGLWSSNAAVLVEPDGPPALFTDFRYIEAARDLEGVAVVETPPRSPR